MGNTVTVLIPDFFYIKEKDILDIYERWDMKDVLSNTTHLQCIIDSCQNCLEKLREGKYIIEYREELDNITFLIPEIFNKYDCILNVIETGSNDVIIGITKQDIDDKFDKINKFENLFPKKEFIISKLKRKTRSDKG